MIFKIISRSSLLDYPKKSMSLKLCLVDHDVLCLGVAVGNYVKIFGYLTLAAGYGLLVPYQNGSDIRLVLER